MSVSGPGGRAPARPVGVSPGLSPIELIATYVMGLLFVATGWMWTTAQISSFITSRSWLPLRIGQAAPVTLSIWQQAGSLAAAFPAEVTEHIAGPLVFWPTAVVLLALALAPLVWWLGKQARTDDDDGGAHWATARDLKPLVVSHPTPGRLNPG